MERAKLLIHTVTKAHIGCYKITSKRYSRKHCLETMVALDPNVRVIYVHLDGKNYEYAYRGTKQLRKGRLVFHFLAYWKRASVETKMPNPPPSLPKRHNRVVEIH